MVLKQFRSVRSYPHSAANKVDQSKRRELERTRELLQEGGAITHDDVQNWRTYKKLIAGCVKSSWSRLKPGELTDRWNMYCSLTGLLSAKYSNKHKEQNKENELDT